MVVAATALCCRCPAFSTPGSVPPGLWRRSQRVEAAPPPRAVPVTGALRERSNEGAEAGADAQLGSRTRGRCHGDPFGSAYHREEAPRSAFVIPVASFSSVSECPSSSSHIRGPTCPAEYYEAGFADADPAECAVQHAAQEYQRANQASGEADAVESADDHLRLAGGGTQVRQVPGGAACGTPVHAGRVPVRLPSAVLIRGRGAGARWRG